MATNITQRTLPPFWASAADNAIFEFDFKPLLMNGIGDDGGNAYILLFGVFDVIPVMGEYIYIASPSYTGTYKILDVSGSNIVTLDTPYITTITADTYYCYHLRVPLFSFYKGHLPGEAFPSDLPYTKVIDIKPSILYEVNGLPYLKINLKGVNKYLFTIAESTTANDIDFSVFNAIRLSWDGVTTVFSTEHDFTYVLNSAITNEELLEKVGIGFYLCNTDKPLISKSGVSFATYFYEPSVNGNFPTIHKFLNGILQ